MLFSKEIMTAIELAVQVCNLTCEENGYDYAAAALLTAIQAANMNEDYLDKLVYEVDKLSLEELSRLGEGN